MKKTKPNMLRFPLQSKQGAMEMTMGTMVTIVLLTMVLILGGYFVSQVFFSAKENIENIDTGIKNEINKLFSDDSSRKIVVYPEKREIKIQKGKDNSGFAFSIRNVEQTESTFSYEVSAIETSCGMTLTKADELIALGKEGTGIKLPAGNFMEDAIFVRFNIPETAPPCRIRYSIDVYKGAKGGTLYSPSLGVDLEIKSE